MVGWNVSLLHQSELSVYVNVFNPPVIYALLLKLDAVTVATWTFALKNI